MAMEALGMKSDMVSKILDSLIGTLYGDPPIPNVGGGGPGAAAAPESQELDAAASDAQHPKRLLF